MLNCKEVTKLAYDSLDRKLNLKERIAMRLHLMMCVLCARFVYQLRFLHQLAQTVTEKRVVWARPRLSQAAREKIRKRLGQTG